jgi:hypothetical protein
LNDGEAGSEGALKERHNPRHEQDRGNYLGFNGLSISCRPNDRKCERTLRLRISNSKAHFNFKDSPIFV